jgi:Xaa-Pro dipeptidase
MAGDREPSRIGLDALIQAKTYPFPLEEYQARLAKVRAEMARRGAEVLLVSEPENLYYLTGYFTTGYWSYQMLVLPLEGDPFFVIRHLERTALLGTSWVEAHEAYLDTERPADEVAAALRRRGLDRARLGVEKNSWYLTVRGYETLRGLLPGAAWVDCANLVNWLRVIKSPREVEYLRRASAAAEAGVRAGIEAAEPGRTEADLAEAIFAALVQNGSDRVDLGVIASGERFLLTHGRFTARRLRPGDPIRFELTGRAAQYDGRFMRCVSLGPPAAELARSAEAAAAALEDAIALMRPGAVAGDVDRAARERLRREAGVEWPTKIGYTMGIMFMPNPGEQNIRTFMPGDTWVLEPGMVFHMLLFGRGMVGHSEMVLVTEAGRERLTHMERRLFVK